MILKEIADKIKEVDKTDTHLFFITRKLKPGTRKNTKSSDKYDFFIYKVDSDNEIRDFLKLSAKQQIEKAISKGVEISEYTVISDDVDQVFTYQLKDKASSFAKILSERLVHHSQIPSLIDLKETATDEELWAYCVGFNQLDDWIYTFRKIKPSKVGIDENDNHNKGFFKKLIRTQFNTKSTKLEVLENETISFDKQMDCIYYKELFYVLHKFDFENMIGMADELKELAFHTIGEIEKLGLLDGIEILTNETVANPSLHRRLVRLSKINLYQNLSQETMSKMQSVALELGKDLKIKDGKIVIENNIDVHIVVELFSDYYKEGRISGKQYGTYSGKELKTSKKT